MDQTIVFLPEIHYTFPVSIDEALVAIAQELRKIIMQQQALNPGARSDHLVDREGRCSL
jgi:hypothetical protein